MTFRYEQNVESICSFIHGAKSLQEINFEGISISNENAFKILAALQMISSLTKIPLILYKNTTFMSKASNVDALCGCVSF